MLPTKELYIQYVDVSLHSSYTGLHFLYNILLVHGSTLAEAGSHSSVSTLSDPFE